MADTLTILLITREKIKTTNVVMGRKPIVKDIAEYKWTAKTLTNVLLKIKEDLNPKSVRILLDDELSYVLTLNIPKELKLPDERAVVAEKIAERIPEILENDDWDFKEINQTKDEKEILVFAPVREFLETLNNAFYQAKLKIEVIEPVSVARKRNSNPIIGLALKQDIRGRDEEVLNIEAETEKPTSLPFLQPSFASSFFKLPNFSKRTIVWFVIISIIAIVIVGYILTP